VFALDVHAGVVLGFSVAGVVGFSLLLGYAGSLLSPPRERAAWFLAWLKTLPWLHGPWLVVPLLIGLVFLGAQVHAGEAAGVFVVMAWMIWSYACLTKWLDATVSVRNRMGLTRRRNTVVFSLFAAMSVVLSAALAIATVLGIIGPLRRG
jgi:hypothetical protein